MNSAVDMARGMRGSDRRRSADRRRSGRDARLRSDVFERFPHGIAVVDRAHRIVTRNRQLDELFGVQDDVDRPATCCALFGCRRPRSLLEDVCLSELVVQAREPLPEVLIEPPRSRTGPLWVTAAPLDDDARQIILEVRRAADDDRHAPARYHWPWRPRLKVYALGPLRVTSSRGPLGTDWLSQRAGQLFKYLVTERHRLVPLEQIADAVWPHAGPSTSNTVRHCIHVLRTNLDPEASRADRAPYIVADSGGYRLNRDLVSVDVDVFEYAISGGLRALSDGDHETAIARFEAAAEMYRGDYLADEWYAEWTLQERERLRDRLTVPLRALVRLRSADSEVAISYLERLAEMEPYDNATQRQLVAALIGLGHRSRAARRYQMFEQRLMRIFNDVPSFSLSDVMRTASPGAGVELSAMSDEALASSERQWSRTGL